MSNPVTPSPEPLFIVLSRKLVLLGLLMIVAALALVIFLHHIRDYSPPLPQVFSDLAMGLIAGLSVRLVLRRQNIFLRIFLMVIFLACSLELVGWFTGWQFGFALFTTVNPGADWIDLAQWLFAAGIALLALYAWAHSAKTDTPATRLPPSRRTSQPRKRPARHPRTAAEPQVAEQVLAQPDPPAQGNATESLAGPKQKRIHHRKTQLHLSAKEEHRCPYCLGLIEPDDPRGTVECNICHTLHHADCWAITGACQVPHYTA